MKLFLEMLHYKRPHLSTFEEIFIDAYLRPLPGFYQDEFGNGIVRVGDSPIMWSCHTDTVHSTDGLQVVTLDKKGNVTSDSNCLGGDNTVGVFLMHQMITRSVPGLYIFHRGEECGRLGSEWIAHHSPELISGIEFSIAFDRRGYKSIITHQCMQRTASELFAAQMSSLLGMDHEADDGGLYTDTYSYADLIPECTNISAGFSSEHTSNEYVHLPYVALLLEKLLTTDFSVLVSHRDPSPAYYMTDYDNLADYIYRYPDETAEYLRCLGITIDEIRDYDKHR